MKGWISSNRETYGYHGKRGQVEDYWGFNQHKTTGTTGKEEQ
ncbi:hypothetical protein HMPREF0580_1209 [Mobiluncus mulieris ATCC 35239]|uniref:Uncharacterized protein n=1 Tax=Mobiluncus mulieris ATCC 35239 TaxID=871571 RepID=E0QQP4_9ACTO|nr:hypothetical protein HMPREF0580_1209 [Mobiluncus mulieris ATCC 35239]EFN93204.1 hypothetical protein HMPREF9278_1294 [Mobiluncus mulieris FB024-16]